MKSRPPQSIAAGHPVDEEALAERLSGQARRELGAWFTPRPVVARVLALVRGHLPAGGPARVVDPACGAGAFLAAAAEAFPAARLCGLELHPASAQLARGRLPQADVRLGDALRGGLDALLPPPASGLHELWLGNPPYNGTSALLKEPAHWQRLCALFSGALPRGTSLRDDFAFFLLLAADRLAQQPGTLAFVTSATLLDAYLYGPLRRHLLDRLRLREVEVLPAGTFRGTRVRTCITVWTSGPLSRRARPRYHDGTGAVRFDPEAPALNLVPAAPEALALDARWRAAGEPLDVLVPLSLTGLKTRFDELLVDASQARLAQRVRDFLQADPDAMESFARAHALPPRLLPKLRALKGRPEVQGLTFSSARIQRFYRFAGPRHRDGIPDADRAFCYLERALIPRGDHRLQGAWNPHLEPCKLVFNLREQPLVSTFLDEPGAVTAWRHARFAPLRVPVDGRTPSGAWRINLSARGLAAAERLGGPRALFLAVARFLQSGPVQSCWAPAFATSRVIPVPVDQLASDGSVGEAVPGDWPPPGIESGRAGR